MLEKVSAVPTKWHCAEVYLLTTGNAVQLSSGKQFCLYLAKLSYKSKKNICVHVTLVL